MIECVFTIDYEIYGNGHGSLQELVVEPTRGLKEVFDRHKVKFVNFVEVVELARIEQEGVDPASAAVRQQVRELHQDGFETALHLHPQWANARHCSGRWELDYSEYNLCTLPPKRIAEIVDRALAFLRGMVGDLGFTPLSFRAGNWLIQPTAAVARVLTERGLKVDSSVFKGGMQHAHGLDYRPALKNGYFWRFSDDVNVATPGGAMLEIPIHVEMVPFWRMITGKRLALQSPRRSAGAPAPQERRPGRLSRLRDYLRPVYPLKFDFCRMTRSEMTSMLERAIAADRADPDTFKPLVAIGHTKDLVDLSAVDHCLQYLAEHKIPVSSLQAVQSQCLS